MSIEHTKPIEVDLSMQNIVDYPTLWGAMMSIEMHNILARRAGYSGLEYFPWTLPHWQVRSGLMTNFAKSSIQSAHQSFRSDFDATRSTRGTIFAIQTAISMPRLTDSLQDLVKLRCLVGRDIPIVTYTSNSHAPITATNQLIQPKPEHIDEWEITEGQLGNSASERGYTGLCLDVFHLRRFSTKDAQKTLGNWRDIIPQLLPYTREIHLAVGRSDFATPFDSLQELRDLIHGTTESEIFEILRLIRNHDWTGRIVTEIPSRSLLPYTNGNRQIMPNEIINLYQKIVANIYQAYN